MSKFIINSDRIALSDGKRDARLFQLAKEVKQSPLKDGVPSWIHIATTGTFRERNFSLSVSDFESMISNFYSSPATRPAFRGHADVYDDGAPAVGHILALARDGNDLWGYVDFIPEFAEQIKRGEYISCSIYFATEGRDKRTNEKIGALLYSLGMTNVPYLDGLTPIALSENEDGTKSRLYLSEKYGDNIQMADQKLEETMEDAETEEANEEVSESDAALEQILSAMREAMEQEELDAAGAIAVLRDPRIQEALKAFAKGEDADSSLPVEEDDSSSELPAVAASEAIKALSELRAENRKLENEIKQLKAKSLDDELDKAIASGQIKPMEKELFRCVALSDRKLFDKTLSERKADPKMQSVSTVALSDVKANAGAVTYESEYAQILKKRVDQIISKHK